MNLVDKIPSEDLIKIDKYLTLYGSPYREISTEDFLKVWSNNKSKLYKLFGDSLFYKFPIKYTRSEDEKSSEYNRILFNINDKFRMKFIDLIYKLMKENKIVVNNYNGTVSPLFSTYNYVMEQVGTKIVISRPDKKKGLQIQSTTKPIRAINSIMNYISDLVEENEYKELFKMFEQFRIECSKVNNADVSNGELVMSIHPLDFITMSDNNSQWSSCMSWYNTGDYHLGTIEMLNSNNTICCYIENKKDKYYFNDKDKTTEWSNKRWRELFYINKDIILSGKGYPYQNENISKIILDKLKELAAKNIGWNYQYGIEQYEDMKHITGTKSLNKIRENIYTHNAYKKNIIIDTHAMYNDFLNDSATKYFCYRNKVKHSKIYSVSGKDECVCCGESINRYHGPIDTDDIYTYYNERYEAHSTVCYGCIKKYLTCESCGHVNMEEMSTIILPSGDKVKVCKECLESMWSIVLCADCGEPFYIGRYHSDKIEVELTGDPIMTKSYWASKEKRLEWTYMHLECALKYGEKKNDNVEIRLDKNSEIYQKIKDNNVIRTLNYDERAKVMSEVLKEYQIDKNTYTIGSFEDKIPKIKYEYHKC